jgi:hypothetical protein
METVFTIIVEGGEEVQRRAVQCSAVLCNAAMKKHHLTTQQQALIKASNGSSRYRKVGDCYPLTSCTRRANPEHQTPQNDILISKTFHEL